jgi:asparagine synthase (glutamine-hydrolysing)
VIVHRGPDDDGYYVADGVGLGMRRLSIIDVEGGHQPVCNEDRTIWVVFNGEIYNFQELRDDLIKRGHVCLSRTDTEVIVHLYEEYGTKCVDHLRGMFGFALWDSKRKMLLLARDRLGIKPMYYAEAGGRLLFGSELKSLLQIGDVERSLNWSSVAHYFSYLTTPNSEAIIEGVKKLEPGCFLIAQPGKGIKVERYWKAQFTPDYGHDEDYFVKGVRERLHESVKLHMIADVPVGSFLSGGIDSSAVVANAAGLTPDPLQTFSIGFGEKEYNELEHARTVANAFGTNHRELVLGPDALEAVEDLAWHLDEPFADSSAIPTYMVSKLAARHVKVVLSGDGGDELFAGYDKYLVEQRERDGRPIPAAARKLMGNVSRMMPGGLKGRNFLHHHSLTGSERYLDAITLYRRDDLLNLLSPEVSPLVAEYQPWISKAQYMESSSNNWLSRIQALDIDNYLPMDILTKVDRMSMAHSIETRVPLLDHKLVEFAATIPPEMNLKGGVTKYILKQAMRGILPDAIIDRPKRGFAVPLQYWFRGQLGPYVRDLLLGESGRRRGLFNLKYVESMVDRNDKGENLDLQLWALISFEVWARTFIDGSSPRARRAAA